MNKQNQKKKKARGKFLALHLTQHKDRKKHVGTSVKVSWLVAAFATKGPGSEFESSSRTLIFSKAKKGDAPSCLGRSGGASPGRSLAYDINIPAGDAS